MSQTVSEYCENHVLVTPQALYGMKDVSTLFHSGKSVIFYKTLEHDLLDVEFCTRSPCLVYIESGQEVITTHDNRTYTLSPDRAICLPAGIHLHSDFAHTTGLLKAYLVFFDADTVTTFLSQYKQSSAATGTQPAPYEIADTNLLHTFFQSIHPMASQQPGAHRLLSLKLQELLHILALDAGPALFACLHSAGAQTKGKRNIARLLEDKHTLRLTVSDLAHLSGRSLSSFNRDFKALFNMPPKRWLIQQRMAHAHQQLQSSSASIIDIALDVGYDNSSHFIKAFRETYGITPNQLRSE